MEAATPSPSSLSEPGEALTVPEHPMLVQFVKDSRVTILLSHALSPGDCEVPRVTLQCDEASLKIPPSVALSSVACVNGVMEVQLRLFADSLFQYLKKKHKMNLSSPKSARMPKEIVCDFGISKVSLPFRGSMYRFELETFLGIVNQKSLQLSKYDQVLETIHKNPYSITSRKVEQPLKLHLLPYSEKAFPRSLAGPPSDAVMGCQSREFVHGVVAENHGLLMSISGIDVCWTTEVPLSHFSQATEKALVSLAETLYDISGVPGGPCVGEAIDDKGSRYPFNPPATTERKPHGVNMVGRYVACWYLKKESVLFSWNLKSWSEIIKKKHNGVPSGPVELRFSVLGCPASLGLTGSIVLKPNRPKEACTAWTKNGGPLRVPPSLHVPNRDRTGHTSASYCLCFPYASDKIRSNNPDNMPAVVYSIEQVLPANHNLPPSVNPPHLALPMDLPQISMSAAMEGKDTMPLSPVPRDHGSECEHSSKRRRTMTPPNIGADPWPYSGGTMIEPSSPHLTASPDSSFLDDPANFPFSLFAGPPELNPFPLEECPPLEDTDMPSSDPLSPSFV